MGLQLRQRIRELIANRDGEILQAVALMQQFAEQSSLDRADAEEDPASQFTALVTTPSNTNIFAARLFDPAGRFVVAYPNYIAEGSLDGRDLPTLKELKPVSHFHAAARVSDLLRPSARSSPTGSLPVPLLEVLIPIHSSARQTLLGIGQFILDGRGIAAEFATLDRHLFLQALIAFGIGSLIIALALGWIFRRLQRANALLEARTADLVRANQELALVAKTSAVGTLTAHLIHGLRSPLFGLHTFMAGRGQEPSSGSDTEWRVAVATTRRMQTMINEVLRVLGEEKGAARYEVSLAELLGTLQTKLQPSASSRDVRLVTRLSGQGLLSNRDANLVLLILENLLQNALQATPPSKTVQLLAHTAEGKVVFEVLDQGPGFPPELRPDVFTPCSSTKPGGSGIGLAISKQLAVHLDAELELKRSTPEGCLFALTLPARLLLKKTELTAPSASR
ncbi:MAG: HAMP domain-containing histidine kinase [Verrucomicrobia bacterium]|nr:HAMP domain-containing histidine kinase [Verrucomicrobiota bacterium]